MIGKTVALFAWWHLVPAGPAVQPPPQLDALEQRLAHDQRKLRGLAREEAVMRRRLAALQLEIKDKQRDAEHSARAARTVEAEIARVQAELQKRARERDALRRELGQRLAGIHRLRRVGMESLLRQVEDPLTAQRTARWLQRVVDHDAGLWRRAKAATRAHERAERHLSAQREEHIRVQARIQEERTALEALQAERRTLLQALKSERAATGALTAALGKTVSQLRTEWHRARRAADAPGFRPGGFAMQRGVLPWPASGRLSAAFGSRVDERTGIVTAHRGIGLEADLSAPVRAVFQGTVAYAGPLQGFGQLVVIDHDDGYRTLYAQLSKLAVRAAQSVGPHQVLGFVGEAEAGTRGALYFEVRHQRQALDPLDWLVDTPPLAPPEPK